MKQDNIIVYTFLIIRVVLLVAVILTSAGSVWWGGPIILLFIFESVAAMLWVSCYESKLIQLRRQLEITEAERDSAVQAAGTDPLTGLFNRRGMSLLARKILKVQMRFVHDDVSRNDLRVTVAVIDLDGFKAVNDTLGHAAGDTVLCLAGELLRRYFGRGTDIVCRLGGDELLVLTIGIDDVESADSRLEEFRRTFKQEADRFLMDQLHVTASCGVKAVSIPKEGEIDLDSLIEQADALLRQAKEKGKDRVVIDD